MRGEREEPRTAGAGAEAPGGEPGGGHGAGLRAGARRRSHFVPRTRAGRMAVGAFLALFVLTQPPVVHTLANRITPWILGMPFLYAWLLGLYLLLIGVLAAALRRDL